MLTPHYRYVLTDLRTDQRLAELPLGGVSFDRRISRVGSLQATLVAPSAELVALARTVYDNVGRSALWVYRGSQVWWGGIVWTATASAGTRDGVQLAVQAATFDSYAHRRRLYDNLVVSQLDQGHLIAKLWDTVQADEGGHIGLDTSGDYTTGVLRDRTYLASAHAKVGKLIEDLGDVIDGPEHTIDTFTDGTGARVKRLRVANRLGVATPRVVFQRGRGGGGRVTDWSYTADTVDAGTTFQTRGDAPSSTSGTDQEPQLSTKLVAEELLNGGWPLLDVTADHSGVSELDTLNGYAQALKATGSGAERTAEYTVQVGDSGWNPNRVGDPVRIKMTDAWHTGGSDVTVRPVGCVVTPPTSTSAESVKLLLGEDN